MKPLANRVLQAYRPLYLRGLLMDGNYRMPPVEVPVDPPAPASRKRMLLVALAGLRHLSSFLSCNPIGKVPVVLHDKALINERATTPSA